MSAIALSWVATIKVGNQTAKQLLQFYASHNFNKPGFEFKNDTLAAQLEVKVRAIQNAHKLLIDKGFINKEQRFGKDGSQLTSVFYLNIPQQFVDNFFGEGVLKTSPPCLKDTPRGVFKTPLNNNINNKHNKREPERKRRVPLSDNFKPDQEREAKATVVSLKCNISQENLLSKFKTIEKGKNRTSTDWQIEYELFLLREKPSAQKIVKQSKPNQENKSTVPEYVQVTNVKPASIEIVDEHMLKIKQMLSRKMINGQSDKSRVGNKESRAR